MAPPARGRVARSNGSNDRVLRHAGRWTHGSRGSPELESSRAEESVVAGSGGRWGGDAREAGDAPPGAAPAGPRDGPRRSRRRGDGACRDGSTGGGRANVGRVAPSRSTGTPKTWSSARDSPIRSKYRGTAMIVMPAANARRISKTSLASDARENATRTVLACASDAACGRSTSSRSGTRPARSRP